MCDLFVEQAQQTLAATCTRIVEDLLALLVPLLLLLHQLVQLTC